MICSCRPLNMLLSATTKRYSSSNVNLLQTILVRTYRRNVPTTYAPPRLMSSHSSSSINQEELQKFRGTATQWWKNNSEYTALRSLNKLRVPLIKEISPTAATTMYQPLKGVRILDVGCGGGILCEPLARLGAHVVGIDPVQENIDAALLHRGEDHPDLSTLTYTCTTIEEYSHQQREAFDIVVASEVVEHVEKANIFLQDCCVALKPGGRVLVTTINRNLLSTLLVKYAAEYMLRIVPPGTHDEDKFVTPNELVDMLRESGLVSINFRGMNMNPLTYEWSWSQSLLMNYACYASKPQ